MPTPTPAPAPNVPPNDNSLIGALLALIRDMWRRNPVIALVLTVLTVIVLLTTLISLGSSKDWAGILGTMGYFVLFLAAFSFLHWRLAPKQAAAPRRGPSPAPATAPQRWVTGIFAAVIAVVSLAFGTALIALNSPGAVQVLGGLGFTSLRSPSCLLRPFSNCDKVLDEIAPVPPKTPPPTVAEPPPALPTTVTRNNFTVYIQYENFSRDWIKALAKDLHDRGWKVPGYTLGGERIPAADGLIEVRYGNRDDEAAAQQLAGEISAFKLTASPLRTRLLPIVKKNVLEVWISP